MKLLLGFAGEQLAGKETAAKRIEELLIRDGFGVRSHRFSDVLRETLTLWDISHGRENEQLLARVIAAPEAFKEDALSHGQQKPGCLKTLRTWGFSMASAGSRMSA